MAKGTLLQQLQQQAAIFWNGWVLSNLVAFSYCLLLLAAVWTFIPYSLEREYESNVEEIHKSNDQMALAFEGYVRSSLRLADQHLIAMKQDFEHGGNKTSMLDYFHHNVASELVNQAMILDRQGRQVFALQEGTEKLELVSRPYFSIHATDRSRGLYIGEYTLGRLSQKPSFFISRRLEAADSSFDGVVALAVNPAYFLRFASDMRIDAEELIRLVGKDGTILASLDKTATETGRNLKTGALFDALAKEPTGRYYSSGQLFGEARFYSYRAMADYPFIIQAGISANRGLAEYRERRKFLYTAGFGATCLAFMYTGAVVWLTRRRRREELQRLQMEADISKRDKALLEDVKLARKIQKALLPAIAPSDYVEVRTVFQPSRQISGDFFFLEWRHEGQVLRGYLVDVSGHGVSTALYTSALNVLLHEVSETDMPVAEQLQWLNRRVGQYFDAGSFAAAIVFDVDLEMREIRYAAAGITEFWRCTGEQAARVVIPGLYLGISDRENYELHRQPLAVGDTLYFLTDGLSDPLRSAAGLPWGRFGEMVEYLDALPERLRLLDDATAICLRIKSLPRETDDTTRWPVKLVINGYADYHRVKGRVCAIIATATGLPHSRPEVAINEALANSLECRDGVARNHRAVLKFSRFGKRFVIRIQTSRIGFAGNALLRRLRANPDDMFGYGEDAAMGRGIPLMLALTDFMTYNDEGTEIMLAWKLNAEWEKGEPT